MNCCERQGFNCRQGRDCPNRKERAVSDLFTWIGGYLDVFFPWHDHKAAVRNAHLAVITARNNRARAAALKGRL